MRRMLAIILLLVLIAVVPAQAASGSIVVPQSAQSDALDAVRSIHSASVAPGKSFSFHTATGADSLGASSVATALYLALRESGAVSFDELSYAENSGILVDADHDFRFTNLSSGALHIAFKTSGDTLTCSVTVDKASASTDAAKSRAPQLLKQGNTVTIPLGDDSAILSNITLAANSIYDTTLVTGDAFSFNASVGPTVPEYGYLPASDGRGETISGGGVNILASALWLLIQDRDDFVIIEKSTYGKSYNQTYVESSVDAILTDYASTADFAFRFTGKNSVTLYTQVEENTLIVSIE